MRRLCIVCHSLVLLGLIGSSAWAEDLPTPDVADSGDAVCDDDSADDDLADILGGGGDTGSDPGDEVEDLIRGEIGDTVGARDESLLEGPQQRGSSTRIIKTLQAKTFLKLGRWELSPHLAFVANDPFLNRYIVGAGVAYNITEIFAVEGMLDFSPDLDRTDWKALTTQLVEENAVSPDISRIIGFGSACFVFSPIYGKVALSGRSIMNFDIYGKFGIGLARTVDDLEALQATSDDAEAVATQIQTHSTTNFGGGIRLIFTENLAARLEGRSMVYIETVKSSTLEMKNNFIVQASVSYFIPSMRL